MIGHDEVNENTDSDHNDQHSEDSRHSCGIGHVGLGDLVVEGL